ncbi:MAG TPA: PilZ domain-containing protein [Phycisphaerae bacterium]|nr:PilZ domain-containing protein [Phycisphaerae bacterium]
MPEEQEQINERRRHRRLPIRLPLECRGRGEPRRRVLRGLTANISSGGIYFEYNLSNEGGSRSLEDVPAGDNLLDMELTVPPGDGHSPYEGRVRTVVEIVRREELPGGAGAGAEGRRRIGLACRFHEPLKLTF